VRQRKTDYGTVVFHWLMVIALTAAFVTGLRIATETPERTWINQFDFLIPYERVWTTHMQAAVVLAGVSVAYVVYLMRSGLVRRVQLDRMRLRGLMRPGAARGGAINVLLYWIFFSTMAALIVTGALMYFGYSAGTDVLMAHWYASWIIPLFAGLHVLTHYAVGGVSQLLRICRPAGLITPPPPLDAVELLTLLVEQTKRNEAYRQSLQPNGAGFANTTRREPAMRREPAWPIMAKPGRDPNRDPNRPDPNRLDPNRPDLNRPGRDPTRPGRNRQRKNLTLQSNAFAVAAAVAIVSTTVVVSMDREAVDTLVVHRINSTDAPILDGETSDPVWRTISPFSVMTSHGGNFDSKGETRIDIRAAHDGAWAYFLFTWADPTRSLKHLPLIKADDGWRLLHNGYEIGDERDFDEDKFSVLLTKSNGILAGDTTFHAGPQPISEAPATLSGRGLHYTENGGYADIWLWKATSGGPTGWMDDAHFGPPVEPTPMQAGGVAPYRGGFAPDPGSSNYSDNFVFIDQATGEINQNIRPLRLPRDVEATEAALGPIDLDPDHGESEGARWFMTEAESQPYTPELDRQIPSGTIVPGVILAGAYSGDRADVRCAARWASGGWALEVARRLDTHSKYDVPIETGTYMRVAAFDHSQIRHTRHVRPIYLEVE
jgi:cytochrome b subunit of formate dehydrogenase